MLYKADPTVIEFVKGFESFVPYPYDDLVAPYRGAYREWTGGPVRGTLTIGYGHTNDARYPLKVVPGLLLDEPKAVEILNVDMDEVEEYTNTHVKQPITQGQFNALLSFGFNCGVGNEQNLIRRINLGNFDEARAAFDLYVFSKGQKLLGLQRRRDGEQALWDMFPTVIPTEIVHHTANVDVERLAA